MRRRVPRVGLVAEEVHGEVVDGQTTQEEDAEGDLAAQNINMTPSSAFLLQNKFMGTPEKKKKKTAE